MVAAATYCPVANLVNFADHLDDPDLYRAMIGAGNRLLRHNSPGAHDSDRPILALNAVDDAPVITEPIRRWDARDPEVTSIRVPAGHLGEGGDPSVYGASVRRALSWLGRRHYTF